VTYSLHLGSRSDDDLRLTQLNEVLHDAATHGPARVLIVAGDLNLDGSNPRFSETLTTAGFREVALARVATTLRRHLLEPVRSY
jgi:endonuclease/exonuclease/phosphatase family metal-dependent hydrolase